MSDDSTPSSAAPPAAAQDATGGADEATPSGRPRRTRDVEALELARSAATADPRTHRFECRSCGYVYDPGEGLKKLGIQQGTPFQDLPDATFLCPVCRSPKPAFVDIGPRGTPSGFTANLNYGFGVNRLTPGQKNVLIFGGFVLAVAFFLSMYALR